MTTRLYETQMAVATARTHTQKKKEQKSILKGLLINKYSQCRLEAVQCINLLR